MLKQKPQDSAFFDGVARIYRDTGKGKPGGLPKPELSFLLSLRFQLRTVGVLRHYNAKRYGEQIDQVIRCPRVTAVHSGDIAQLPDGKYIIRQIQTPEGTAFPVMDLALERTECNESEGKADGHGSS